MMIQKNLSPTTHFASLFFLCQKPVQPPEELAVEHGEQPFHLPPRHAAVLGKPAHRLMHHAHDERIRLCPHAERLTKTDGKADDAGKRPSGPTARIPQVGDCAVFVNDHPNRFGTTEKL